MSKEEGGSTGDEIITVILPGDKPDNDKTLEPEHRVIMKKKDVKMYDESKRYWLCGRCKHDINDHAPSDNILVIPAGKCNYSDNMSSQPCICGQYEDGGETRDSDFEI